MRKLVTDAEFEVIKGPDRPIAPYREPRRDVDVLQILRWCFLGFMGLVAAFVALIGLLGADLDTRDDIRPEPYAMKPGLQPDGSIAVAPVD